NNRFLESVSSLPHVSDCWSEEEWFVKYSFYSNVLIGFLLLESSTIQTIQSLETIAGIEMICGCFKTEV
ncbi:hypothetical protein M8C21_012787, partial [Ambrosia artemisiifolia]